MISCVIFYPQCLSQGLRNHSEVTENCGLVRKSQQSRTGWAREKCACHWTSSEYRLLDATFVLIWGSGWVSIDQILGLEGQVRNTHHSCCVWPSLLPSRVWSGAKELAGVTCQPDGSVLMWLVKVTGLLSLIRVGEVNHPGIRDAS